MRQHFLDAATTVVHVPGRDFPYPKVIFGRAFIAVTGAPGVGVFFAILETTREPNQKKMYGHEVDVKADVSI